MAATTDKARYYLEQYVPELQEYQQKGVFSREEITAITSKRSGFEHILNARGSTPGDYARYATYEMNLDALRKKRCKRLGVKAKTFNGQRTVFFVLDRATKKFPGDLGLWMQYIQFCQKEKANKKLAKVFTKLLRLHPRDWNLWVLAAKHYAENMGDMGTARSYLQRGLRFCRDEKKLYLEYTKLEMVYLAKLAARKKILGLEQRGEEKTQEDEDMIALPSITAEDIDPDAAKGVEEVNEDALKRLEAAPAFSGAIPIAIFDAATKQFKKDGPEVAEVFFKLVASFDSVQASPRILQHILDHLRNTAPGTVETIICEARWEMFAIEAQSAEFPAALGKALALVRGGLDATAEKLRPRLAENAVLMLLPILTAVRVGTFMLDEDITLVITSSIKRYLRIIRQARPSPGGTSATARMLATLQQGGKDQEKSTLEGLMEAGYG